MTDDELQSTLVMLERELRRRAILLETGHAGRPTPPRLARLRELYNVVWLNTLQWCNDCGGPKNSKWAVGPTGHFIPKCRCVGPDDADTPVVVGP
jgi:hypothetical protein